MNIDIEKPSFKQLVLLNMQQLTNFPYIEKDFDAVTDYQLLCKVVEYLNDVIKNQNTTNDTVVGLYNAFIALKDYVDNYFKNLDVQDEINNKLDEMAESGQLTDIIAQYLGLAGMITFNNVIEMKQATNLVNGSKCSTLGFHEVNDGGKALYKIRTITNEDVIDEASIIALNDNTLIAELIYDTANVKQFGAYGDGIHDDTESIQKAINKTKSNLYIPSGNYKISPTAQYLIEGYGSNIRPYYGLYINNKSNINIKCEGVLIPDYSTNNMNIIAIQHSNNINIDGLKSIINESYVDHGTILQTRSLLNINKCDNIHVTNCFIENIGSCCIMVASTNSTIENSKATRTSLDYKNGSYFGLYVSENCLINNNICYGASNDGDIAIFGVCKKCGATNNKLFSYLENDNTINMTGSQGLGIDSACSECFANNNYLDKYYYGIDIKTSCRNNIISNNFIMNCKYGIASRRGEGNQITSDLTISENIIMPNNGNGNTDTIKDTTSTAVGILISNTLHCNITDNIIIPLLTSETTTQAYNYIGILLSDIPTNNEGTLQLFKISGNQIIQRNALGNNTCYNTGRALYILGTSNNIASHVSITNNNIKPAFGNVTDYSIYLNYGKDILISNNLLTNGNVSSGENGHIYCNNSSYINISNNTMDSARHTLVIENSTDINFNNNLFTAYGGYIDAVQLNNVERMFITGNYYKGKGNDGALFRLTSCNNLNFTNNSSYTNKTSIFNDNGSSTNITNENNVFWSIS